MFIGSQAKSLRPFAVAAMLTSIVIFAGCARTLINVTSVPEGAEVVAAAASGKNQVLGKTPLTVQVTDEMMGSASVLNLIIRKDAYVAQSLLIPRSIGPATHDVSIQLVEFASLAGVPRESDAQCAASSADQAQKIARGVAEAQSLIASKNFDSAIVKLTVMTSQHPNIAVIFDLLGNANFLQGRYQDALAAYDRSFRLDPENLEASRMIRRVKTMLGQSASGGE